MNFKYFFILQQHPHSRSHRYVFYPVFFVSFHRFFFSLPILSDIFYMNNYLLPRYPPFILTHPAGLSIISPLILLRMRCNCHNNNFSSLLAVKEKYSIGSRCILLGISFKNFLPPRPLKRRKLVRL